MLGLRPENLTLARLADDDLALPASLSLIEPLGSETLITLRIGDAEMMARVSAAFRAPAGHALTMFVNPNQLHLFDRASGHALRQ
jgi:multiple sugar transport system ATP-binding protein